MARPNPRAAPVTSATCPSRPNDGRTSTACELTSRLRGAAPPLGTCFSETDDETTQALTGKTKAVRLALYEERKPTLIIRLNSESDTVMAVSIDDGLITGLYAVRNPEKLPHMGRETALRR
jgi:hypothetical protein